MKTLHVIGGLGNGSGGAEKVLTDLLQSLPAQDNDVLSFLRGSYYANQLESIGHRVVKGSLLISLGRFISSGTINGVANGRYDVIVGWMYYGSIVAYILGWKSRKIVFYIHNAEIDKSCTTLLLRLSVAVCGLISRLDKRVHIVYCSERSRTTHSDMGWSNERYNVIINGVRISNRVDVDVRRADRLTIGHIGRFHPVKDHRFLVEVLGRLGAIRQDWHCYIAGPGVDEQNSELKKLISKASVRDKVTLCGSVDDTEWFYRSLDILVLTSRNESCPLVILESLSYGVPCISTEVGDVERLVGRDGLVVKGRDTSEFAEALAGLMHREDKEVRLDRSERSVERFGMEEMAKKFRRVII